MNEEKLRLFAVKVEDLDLVSYSTFEKPDKIRMRLQKSSLALAKEYKVEINHINSF